MSSLFDGVQNFTPAFTGQELAIRQAAVTAGSGGGGGGGAPGGNEMPFTLEKEPKGTFTTPEGKKYSPGSVVGALGGALSGYDRSWGEVSTKDTFRLNPTEAGRGAKQDTGVGGFMSWFKRLFRFRGGS
jgi:hypothetical protein